MNNNRDLFLTPEGARKIKEELAQLKGPRRQELAKRLRYAISQGDLSENADYIAAKEEQAFLEGKILELETILREAEVIETPTETEEVAIGSTVLVSDDTGEQQTYLIVGMKEADPRNGKISNESPIGRALLGKHVGDVAVAKTPGGDYSLKIIAIR